MHPNRVFITGRSALTASGSTADETWSALCAGRTGIDQIKNWELAEWSHRLGGELKNFQPVKMLPDRKLIKVISRHDVMGIHAAIAAVENSQIISYRDSLACPIEFNDKTGIFVGSPGNKYFQQYDFLPLIAKTKGKMHEFANELFNEVHPMWLLRILPNNVLAYTGISYGFKGANQNITNHAVGGIQALLEAYQAIQSGQVDRAVVVAYDIGVEPQALFYYEKLGLLSERHLKPFDAQADGTILAEGAAALVLESEASVKARLASCYGEIVGGLSATENKGLFSIESNGAQLSQVIQRSLDLANLQTSDIGLVVAHGNGNAKSDDSEALALGKVFVEHKPPVTAFKWSMGHALSASGLLDTVMVSYVLQAQSAPGISNLEQLSSASQGLKLSATAQAIAPNSHALIINRGFSSMNACLVVKACG